MPTATKIQRGDILVADANADYRSLLCHYLVHLGYPAPLEAKDGIEALTMAISREPRVMIMELRLPNLHGFEVIARLRNEQRIHRTRHVWTIAATAMALPGDREKCLAGGFDSYLAKPFTLDEFADLLATVMAAEPLFARSRF